MDATWAETGDRYMLKLFRDFLFHQVGAAYKGDRHVLKLFRDFLFHQVGSYRRDWLTSRN